MKIKLPKFRVNDIVTFYDDSAYDETCKVCRVARIESVNIFTGPGSFSEHDTTGFITYSLSGCAHIDMNEDDITAFDTMHDLMTEINK